MTHSKNRLNPDSPCAAKVFPSPNHGERLGRWAISGPDTIILHYTGMPTGESALHWLVNPVSEVSCHYFVWEDGGILQLVPEARRAWHAGKSSWAGETDLNSASIGIEIVNVGHDGGPPAFPEAQIKAIVALCKDISARLDIAPERLLAHSDIAPGRKRDPGETFPWDQLHKAGLGHWTKPHPIGGGRFLEHGLHGQPVEALQSMLAMFGYSVEIDGHYADQTKAVVEAFQRHYRPERVDGIADASTIMTLRDLIATRRGSSA